METRDGRNCEGTLFLSFFFWFDFCPLFFGFLSLSLNIAPGWLEGGAQEAGLGRPSGEKGRGSPREAAWVALGEAQAF
jgi:hypothetical protein